LSMSSIELIKAEIRDIYDFPKPGVIFKDITPVLKNPDTFKAAIDLFADRYHGESIDAILGIDARGFIFGAALAYELGLPFVPVRKKGKLPYESIEVFYDLEYGSAALEMHADAIDQGDQVLVIDDLLATGGTAKAVAELVEKLGGVITEFAFMVELGFLPGREKLEGYKVYSPVIY